MIKGLFSADIAALMDLSVRAVQKQAACERWPSRRALNPATGQRQPRYLFLGLPLEIQAAWCEGAGKSLQKAIAELEADNRPGTDALPFDRYPERHRRIAFDRKQLLNLVQDQCLPVNLALKKYNTGFVDEKLFSRLGTVSHPTHSRWKKAYGEGGLAALCPRYSHTEHSAGERALDEQDKAFIRKYYLNENRPSLKAALRWIEKCENVTLPYSTALRYVRSLPPAHVTRARWGEKKYQEDFEPHITIDYSRYRVLEWVCADHKTFDILVTHKGKIIRPYLTAFQDLRSRKLLGWHICETPSTISILRAMEHVISRFGLFEKLKADNGKDFKSKMLHGEKVKIREDTLWGMEEERSVDIRGLLEELRVEVRHTLPYRGQSKAIERFFGTLIGDFEKAQPSYIGSNSAQRKDEAALYYRRFKGRGKIDVPLALDGLREAFDAWAHDWNATHKHSGSGMKGRTPDEVFAEGWKVHRKVPASHLPLLFSEKKTLFVHADGVHWDGLSYYSRQSMLTLKGTRVIARRPLGNVGRLWLYDLQGRYLTQAENSILADKGVTAENLKEVTKARKKDREVLRSLIGDTMPASGLMKEIALALLENAQPETCFHPEEEVIELAAGGEADPRPLPDPEEDKPAVKGLFDEPFYRPFKEN